MYVFSIEISFSHGKLIFFIKNIDINVRFSSKKISREENEIFRLNKIIFSERRKCDFSEESKKLFRFEEKNCI